jgi:hypothetical protein
MIVVCQLRGVVTRSDTFVRTCAPRQRALKLLTTAAPSQLPPFKTSPRTRIGRPIRKRVRLSRELHAGEKSRVARLQVHRLSSHTLDSTSSPAPTTRRLVSDDSLAGCPRPVEHRPSPSPRQPNERKCFRVRPRKGTGARFVCRLEAADAAGSCDRPPPGGVPSIAQGGAVFYMPQEEQDDVDGGDDEIEEGGPADPAAVDWTSGVAPAR